MIRKYSDLVRLQSFEERYEYLKLSGSVGTSTFGFERYLNQQFYTSIQWRTIRRHVILRDNSCDLGISDHEILHKIIIHHMNPVIPSDFENGNVDILDPEFLISVSSRTHLAIHFGDASLVDNLPKERRAGDTILWR